MNYWTEVLTWLVAGAAVGLAVGEGIFRIRKTAAKNRR